MARDEGRRLAAHHGARLGRTYNPAMAEKLIVDNRKARHDFHLLVRFEAGVVLSGTYL